MILCLGLFLFYLVGISLDAFDIVHYLQVVVMAAGSPVSKSPCLYLIGIVPLADRDFELLDRWFRYDLGCLPGRSFLACS